ncbi:MAG: hypothetical protein JWM36_2221 [Hyphomicrobiales bacterium]|nr:hypothetical protein [Hyphomicrobiales bacterium]
MAYKGSQSGWRPRRYFLSLQRGEDLRCVPLHPLAFFMAVVLIPATMLGFACTSSYIYFRDDALRALATHNMTVEQAYQIRISSLQTQLDRVSTRQLVDQETLETRIVDMASRQSRLETRSAMLASLADAAGLPRNAEPARPVASTTRQSINPLLATPAAPALPAGVTSYSDARAPSPFGRPMAMPADGKPQPESLEPMDAPTQPASAHGLGLRSQTQTPVGAIVADRSLPMTTRMRSLAASLDSLDLAQVSAIDKMAGAIRSRTDTIESAFSAAGLNPAELKMPKAHGATGGPFVPLVDEQDDSLFGRGVKRLQGALEKSQRLVGLLPHVPLRQPLPGSLEVTSSYGGRMDPFYGRAAMHTGLDLRDDLGSPVRVTAAGRVVSAGWNGGYGNMVEVDHGNGLLTRYAHLSAIDVKEGQSVEAGDICGRLGSTGRSTGPHLHYEVRVDGEPVDPTRFLRAGGRLPAMTLASASRR